MRRLGWMLAVGLWAPPVLAQQPAGAPVTPPAPPAGSLLKADPADVGSLDGIMKAVYEVISGPAGQPRNWTRMHSLFVPGARLGPAVKLPNGRVVPQMGTLDEWIANSEPFLMKDGFFEKEIGRRAEAFGRIAH